MATRARVYPHNDLSNLAHYQLQGIRAKVANGNDDGLALDCMACLISLAFSVEAFINFLGDHKLDKWNERSPFKNKIEAVCAGIGMKFDKQTEPFTSIWKLKETRDSIAHAKPKLVTGDEDPQELMAADWDKLLDHEFLEQAYTRVSEFEKTVLAGYQISIVDSLTSSTTASK